MKCAAVLIFRKKVVWLQGVHCRYLWKGGTSWRVWGSLYWRTDPGSSPWRTEGYHTGPASLCTAPGTPL